MWNMTQRRTVTKEYKWEAAHRLVSDYPDNCRHLHGHSYRCTITMELLPGQDLNEFGFIYDYNDMKRMKKWINDNFDHACFVSDQDEELLRFITSQKNRDKHYLVRGQSSAENISHIIFKEASKILNDDRAQVIEVTVNETCTSETRYFKALFWKSFGPLLLRWACW